MSEWISVKDKLPENDEYVLIWWLKACLSFRSGPNVYLGRYLHTLKQFRPLGGNGNFNDEITHWQPLPSPPK